jgi:exoribonuclease-2
MTVKSLVLYKGKCAIVRAVDDSGKITIYTQNAQNTKTDEYKVRKKDITLLHPGPVESFEELKSPLPGNEDMRLFWELFLDEQNAGGAVRTLQDLAILTNNKWTAQTAWAAYLMLKEDLYFTGTPESVIAKSREEVDALLSSRAAKEAETAKRSAFLVRLRERRLNLPDDIVFMQDVEALALGCTDKSRTMREAGITETPVEAHKTLLATGVWDNFVNPFPAREGLILKQAKAETAPPPDEERTDLTALPAYAIDNEDSADPDDALSITEEDGKCVLYVHVADPAASILSGSEADIEARQRGATVYLPEICCRMLHENSLAHYALGVAPKSPALSFKLTLNADGSIARVEIFPSIVAVTRLSYKQADTILNIVDSSDLRNGANVEYSFNLEACKNTLLKLREVARRNTERRLNAGAFIIEFPEAHVTVKDKQIIVETYTAFESNALVRECMLLAGEGAAQWAIMRRIPFPFVSQECGDIPDSLPGGFAGAYHLRRAMRPRLLSVKPGLHWGLGLDIYSQVTSPLRRYTDLLCHQQIRAVLAGKTPLGEDEVLCALAVSEQGAIAATRAGRSSVAHWTRVYLSANINSVWDAVVLDRKGTSTAVVFIPQLGLETQTTLHGETMLLKLNAEIKVKITSVNIAEGITNTGIEHEVVNACF